jgi:hypothetical protein
MRFSRAGTLPLVFLPFSHSGRIPSPLAVEPHRFQPLVTERIPARSVGCHPGGKGYSYSRKGVSHSAPFCLGWAVKSVRPEREARSGGTCSSQFHRLAAHFWDRNPSVPYICPPLADVGTTNFNSSPVVLSQTEMLYSNVCSDQLSP